MRLFCILSDKQLLSSYLTKDHDTFLFHILKFVDFDMYKAHELWSKPDPCGLIWACIKTVKRYIDQGHIWTPPDPKKVYGRTLKQDIT